MNSDHPWGNFLDARIKCMLWLKNEKNRSNASIAYQLSMHEDGVNKIFEANQRIQEKIPHITPGEAIKFEVYPEILQRLEQLTQSILTLAETQKIIAQNCIDAFAQIDQRLKTLETI